MLPDGINFAGIAELGWRATRTVRRLNGYDDWDKLTTTEQKALQLEWRALPLYARKRYIKAVTAACDAFARAIAV